MKVIFLYLILFITFSSCVAQKPYTFVKNPQIFIENNEKIKKGSKQLNSAKIELVNEANKILKKRELYSVTFKSQLPPSNSKNDYYSMAPYWWPDETKEDGIPYKRKDGKVNPESKQIIDGYMLGSISTDVYKLGLAYFYTQDEKYVKWINELIAVFFINTETKMNPHFNYAQLIPGRKRLEGGSITIGSVSFIRFLEGVQFVKHSREFDQEQLHKLKQWFSDFVSWMENDNAPKMESKAQNNIGVYYTAQLVTYHLFIGNEAKAKNILETQGKYIVDKQISHDGALKAELKRATPWSYVRYTITAFDYLVALSDILDVDLYCYANAEGGSIDKMYKWLLPYAESKKRWLYSNESPSSRQMQKVLLRSNIVNYKTKVMDKDMGLNYLEILTNNIY